MDMGWGGRTYIRHLSLGRPGNDLLSNWGAFSELPTSGVIFEGSTADRSFYKIRPIRLGTFRIATGYR